MLRAATVTVAAALCAASMTDTSGRGVGVTRFRAPTIAFRRVGTAVLPALDLVVATLGRSDELARLLDSLERQTHQRFRLVVVDQNADDRVDAVLAGRDALEVLRLRSAPGLSRAR